LTDPPKREHWDLVLEPRVAVFDLQLREVWRYKDLLWLFVRRDFVAQYRQTVLGFLWHVIQPLLTTLMFLLVFGRIANIPTDGIEPPLLFYMAGITVWNYFSTCLTGTSTTFITNAAIFGKVYFPRLVLPLSVTLSNIIRFGIQFALLLGFMIYFAFKGHSIHFSWSWLAMPVLVLMMAGLALGLGIIISSMTTKYRDLAVLMTFAIQLAMYVTPIGYPLSYLKQKHPDYVWIIKLNPMTSIVEAFRYTIFGKGTLDLPGLGYSLGFAIVSLIIGIVIFNRVEKTFMDTV
jgi:lipopolysaccharide transport system permease protein